MLREFATQVNRGTVSKRFDPKRHRIKYVLSFGCLRQQLSTSSPSSCLAHVINLATQALISAYSKTPHFDPTTPDDHLNIAGAQTAARDEVGLIRAIAVKVT